MYTYLIGWSKQNKWYYGSRVANKHEPKYDLWICYFTSSKYVQEMVDKFGDPDVIQVRKTFSSIEETRKYEEKVLRRLKVKEKDFWINKNDTLAPPILYGLDNGFYGKTHSNETKLQWSKIRSGRKLSTKIKIKLKGRIPWNKGKFHSNETKLKISKANKGKKTWSGKNHSDRSKLQMSSVKKGKSTVPCSEETKTKISNSRKGKKWYNNGLTSVCCVPENRPKGFKEGLIKKSNGLSGKSLSYETKLKISKTRNEKYGYIMRIEEVKGEND